MLTSRPAVAGAVASATLMAILTLGQTVTAGLGDDGSTSSRRVEVPDAGLFLEIPAAWDDSVVPNPELEELVLPEAYGETSAFLKVLYVAYTFDATNAIWCELAGYQDMPLSLQEHADWYEHLISTAPGFTGHTQVQPFDLPVGEAIRVDSGYLDGEQRVRYLFDAAGVRYHLDCETDVSRMPEDGWLEMARSIEPLAGAAPEHDGAAALARSVDTKSVTGYWDYAYVIPPDDPAFPSASVMWSWCDIVTWLEADDGSASEWFRCTLTDEPIEPAEQQGRPPDEVLTITGGPCGWHSAYWWQAAERQVYASAYEITVTPGGQVFGRADFPAEPLVCDS